MVLRFFESPDDSRYAILNLDRRRRPLRGLSEPFQSRLRCLSEGPAYTHFFDFPGPPSTPCLRIFLARFRQTRKYREHKNAKNCIKTSALSPNSLDTDPEGGNRPLRIFLARFRQTRKYRVIFGVNLGRNSDELRTDGRTELVDPDGRTSWIPRFVRLRGPRFAIHDFKSRPPFNTLLRAFATDFRPKIRKHKNVKNAIKTRALSSNSLHTDP